MDFATDEGRLDRNYVVSVSKIVVKTYDGDSCVVRVVVTVEAHFP